MTRHSKSRFLAGLGGLAMIVGAAGVAHADENARFELVPGETDYVLPVEVTNRNAEPINDVAVTVVDQPDGLTGFRVEPPSIDTLEPRETARFIIRFDVRGDAPSDEAARIGLRVTAADAEFDRAEPEIVVSISEGVQGLCGVRYEGTPTGKPTDQFSLVRNPQAGPGNPLTFFLSVAALCEGCARGPDLFYKRAIASVKQRAASSNGDLVLVAGTKDQMCAYLTADCQWVASEYDPGTWCGIPYKAN